MAKDLKLRTDFIKDKLKENNWSQNELSRRTNISKSEISKILSGKRGVGRKVASGLLRVFPEESVDTLFKKKEVL